MFHCRKSSSSPPRSRMEGPIRAPVTMAAYASAPHRWAPYGGIDRKEPVGNPDVVPTVSFANEPAAVIGLGSGRHRDRERLPKRRMTALLALACQSTIR